MYTKYLLCLLLTVATPLLFASSNETIVIIGSGYVGLVTGTCMAEMGHEVVCVDNNREKVTLLQHGIVPIYEPGLEEMLHRNAHEGRLSFTSDYGIALANAKVCFIAVDTPMNEKGEANLKAMKSVAASIGEVLDHYVVVVNKSTVPVGTANLVRKIIQEKLETRGIDVAFDVVSNPEFLKEGEAINDFMRPDRVVIGTASDKAADIMKALYKPFMLNHDRLLLMDIASAELTKYAANAMLALRISFMNELSALCEEAGADITQIRIGIGSDKRIGYSFLYPGPGFGGSCLPKDVRALRMQAKNFGCKTAILDAIETVNQHQKKVVCSKIAKYFENRGGIEGKTVAILGLAFKPNTDDMREAPAITLVEELLDFGAHVRLYDPVAMEQAKRVMPLSHAITWCDSAYAAMLGVDAIVLMTEWKQFRALNFELVRSNMQGQAFFDARNQFVSKDMAKLGFDYISIGQPPAFASTEK